MAKGKAGSRVSGLPERPLDRDTQVARSAGKTYGPTTADPKDPIEGYPWIRRDLNPPQMRVKIGGTIFKLDFTAV